MLLSMRLHLAAELSANGDDDGGSVAANIHRFASLRVRAGYEHLGVCDLILRRAYGSVVPTRVMGVW